MLPKRRWRVRGARGELGVRWKQRGHRRRDSWGCIRGVWCASNTLGVRPTRWDAFEMLDVGNRVVQNRNRRRFGVDLELDLNF